MVRRRRDEADPRGGVAGARDPGVHLGRRELTALTGLGTLGEFDLDVVGLGEVEARDTESTRGHLLDRTAPLGVDETVGVFPALPCVRLAADPVHRDRERLVRLLGDGAVAHRPRGEALDDRRDGLDLVQRHGLARAGPQREQAAQRLQLRRLVVDELRVLAEDVVTAGPRGVLELEHRLRVEEVRRAVASPLVLATGPQPLMGTGRGVLRVGVVVAGLVLGEDLLDPDSAQLRLGTREVGVDELRAEADRLEHLRARIGRHRGDAHLRHDLQHALAERVDEVLDGLLRGDARDVAGAHEVLDRLHGQVRVDRRGTVADERRDVVHLAHVPGLDDQTDLHPVLAPDEVVVDRRHHEQRRDRDEILVRVAVGQDDELRAVLDGLIDLGAHLGEALGEGVGSRVEVVQAADRGARTPGQGLVDVPDLRELVVVDDREVERHRAGVLRTPGQQIDLRAQTELEARDDLFADRVERRVGHLRELLREVVEEQPRALAEHGDRGVRAHGAQRLDTRLAHRGEEDADLLLRVPEGALPPGDGGRRVHDVLALGEVGQADGTGVEPLLPRVHRREIVLDLLILDDPALGGVDEEHLAGLQPAATLDALRLEVQHAGLGADDDEAVGGLRPASGTQAVAVQGRADERAVGEDEGGRAVPRLHLVGVVLVERAQLRRDVGLLLVRLRHHHHDRVRQAAAGEGE